MVNVQIEWSDSLEKLAELLFTTAEQRQDPFETECTVVGSPVMAGWLKQYFLYDLPKEKKGNRVLAGWDFKMLHPFVNDWLGKACAGTPVGQRDPSQHPYSIGVLQWRIWNELSAAHGLREYAQLDAYAGGDPAAADRKRWGLAARLAKLFDDYQNYRPDLLRNWEMQGYDGLPETLRWQAVMWRRLVDAEPDTYLRQFAEMPIQLKSSGIAEAYRRITVFHTSALPRAYMQFFVELGKIMDVRMFVFNPSKEFWIEDQSERQRLRDLAKDGATLGWMDPPHPLLSGFGRGIQSLLATALDVTDGQIGDECWSSDSNETLLQKIQRDIRGKGGESAITDEKDDGSIQLHVCHGPQREVEVAKDLILKWFEEHPGSQPRDVQVLVPDLDAYAPFIESVFQVKDPNPLIPCSISKRPAVSAGAVGSAFVRLMKFNESRMTASEALELLELDPVRQRYELEPADLSEIRSLMNHARIRWGRDGSHLMHVVKGKDLPDTVTWRRGLDRLLAGFAVGRGAEGEDVIEAGALGALSVCDRVEGDSTRLVGTLTQYFEDLCQTADEIKGMNRVKVSEWAEFYTGLLDRFFRGTESSFGELTEIRRGITSVRRAAGLAGDPEVGAEVMALAMEAQLGGMEPAGRSDINVVLFSPMRTMQVTPRKLIILMGLNEGAFPRADDRTAFDLLSRAPRYGDRSLRQEDRLAFLEALMSARERLILTYTGRNISNNKEIPPSPAVTEFRQYLDAHSSRRDAAGQRAPLVAPVEQRLHGFNPEYYRRGSTLFSYSQSNYDAACAWVEPPAATAPAKDRAHPAAAAEGLVSLEELQEFFVNPAKHFLLNVLKIRLLDPTRDAVSDSEMFEGDPREDYQLSAMMLRDLLDKSRSDERADFNEADAGSVYYERLQEQALIPLGTFGRGRARQRLADLRTFLNDTRGFSAHANLYQALRDLRAAEKNPAGITVPCGRYSVAGHLPLMEYKGRRFLLRFRYASLNAKDLVRAWVAHVVGHAAGQVFFTDLLGKAEQDQISILPLDADVASLLLTEMLQLYARGGQDLLPFAPACSVEYATGFASSDNEEQALDKADVAWSESPYPECRDPYLWEAWGAEGPMQHPDFGAMAATFWAKYLERSAQDPSASEAVGEEDRA